jgi:Icc-related predicted phosphoesterase
MRIAAVGDLHVGHDSAGSLAEGFAGLADHADLLLLAGDLTTLGDAAQAEILVRELGAPTVPVISVLGNHDHHGGEPHAVRRVLERGGVTVLERESTVVEIDGCRVGVVGAKGFGGGFIGASVTEFGEAEMKAFARTTIDIAADLERLLSALDADVRIALLHYAPIRDTLAGEPPEIFPFLGSYLFAEAIDRAGADLVVHGHAHRGAEQGSTPGGVPVRNVAKAVLRSAYSVYVVEPKVRAVAGGGPATGS